MKYSFDYGKHSVSSLNYHLVQCIKYRRKVLNDPEIVEELKSRTRKIAEIYGIRITAMEPDEDHIHILFSAMPKTDLVKFVNNWKGSTSKVINNRFRDRMKDKLWKGRFWSPSYCLISTGQTTLEQVRKYVENQGKERPL
jgi:putative transposase